MSLISPKPSRDLYATQWRNRFSEPWSALSWKKPTCVGTTFTAQRASSPLWEQECQCNEKNNVPACQIVWHISVNCCFGQVNPAYGTNSPDSWLKLYQWIHIIHHFCPIDDRSLSKHKALYKELTPWCGTQKSVYKNIFLTHILVTIRHNVGSM